MKWIKSPQTGNLISEATRFCIKKAYPIKANTLVVLPCGKLHISECRVELWDRIGGEKNPDGSVGKAVYLCLTIESAKELAKDLIAGKGVLAV